METNTRVARAAWQPMPDGTYEAVFPVLTLSYAPGKPVRCALHRVVSSQSQSEPPTLIDPASCVIHETILGPGSVTGNWIPLRRLKHFTPLEPVGSAFMTVRYFKNTSCPDAAPALTECAAGVERSEHHWIPDDTSASGGGWVCYIGPNYGFSWSAESGVRRFGPTPAVRQYACFGPRRGLLVPYEPGAASAGPDLDLGGVCVKAGSVVEVLTVCGLGAPGVPREAHPHNTAPYRCLVEDTPELRRAALPACPYTHYTDSGKFGAVFLSGHTVYAVTGPWYNVHSARVVFDQKQGKRFDGVICTNFPDVRCWVRFKGQEQLHVINQPGCHLRSVVLIARPSPPHDYSVLAQEACVAPTCSVTLPPEVPSTAEPKWQYGWEPEPSPRAVAAAWHADWDPPTDSGEKQEGPPPSLPVPATAPKPHEEAAALLRRALELLTSDEGVGTGTHNKGNGNDSAKTS